MSIDLVSIDELAPDIIIDLKYATADNITGKPIYVSGEAFLQPKAANALVKVVELINTQNLRLVVWDAFRPESAQKVLRKRSSDERYVRQNSIHSKGLAVDVTLMDAGGRYLDMGTGFDDFSEAAHTGAKSINKTQSQNRTILRSAMSIAGFKQWPYEWWHFDYMK